MTRASSIARHVRHACAGLAYVLASAQVARAQTFTLGDIFDRLRTGEQIVDFARTHPAVDRRITVLEAYVVSQNAMGIGLDSLTAIYTRDKADFATVLRWNRDQVALTLPGGFVDSLAQISVMAHGSLMNELAAKIGKDSLDVLYKPIDTFLQKVHENRLAANQEKLRRFSVKYGPDSPHLNLVEAGLNYVGQLILPGLLLGHEGAPSPFELVATYRTTDLTASQSATERTKLRMVTSAQLGLRWYNFAPGCGQGGKMQELLHPCHISGGAFLMGPSDTPLAKFWGSGRRAGAYGAWGGYHMGYVAGAEKRLVFGLDTQVLPYVF
jgi:hypothetical protein